MLKRITALALTTFVLAAGLLALPFKACATVASARDDVKTEIRALFVNVGKADAALFCLGDRRYLIDTGSKESADALLGALSAFRVEKLDGVMITHTDKDHVGGLKALLKSDITVEQLYAGMFSNVESIQEHPVAKLADKYGVALTWLKAGDSVPVAEAIGFSVLGPLRQDTADENNNSLVLRLTTPQGAMLLTGDMETAEEDDLMAAGLIQPAAVMKIGHHGEGDASGAAFLYRVKPQIAVISTDSSVEPDTPDPGVMGRLWDIGAEVYVTQKAALGVQVTLIDGNAVGRLINETGD